MRSVPRWILADNRIGTCNRCPANDSNVYDVLRYISYAKGTRTRSERVREFVTFVLDTYEKSGENELSMDNLRELIQLKYRTMPNALKHLGSPEDIVEDYLSLQHELYSIENMIDSIA